MSFAAPRPVVSGKPYAVRQVRDHAPAQLEDFTGDTTFVIDLDGEDYTVWGAGIEAATCARVFEKSEQGAGKDVRVWNVSPRAEGGGFTATHGGIDVPEQVRGRA